MTLTPEMRSIAEGIAKAIPLESSQITRIGPKTEPRVAANDPIGSEIARRVIELRKAWEWVGAAHQNYHPACETCGFCESFEGGPGEMLSECALGRRGESPMQCPAYAAHVADLAEDEAMTKEMEEL